MCTAPRIVYQQGDHVCTLYSTPEEQLAAAIEYIRAGLERGERCLYVCGEHEIKDFCRALDAAGIDVKREKARGALLLVAKHEAHLKGGTFDPSAMIDLLNTAVKEALDQGAAVLDHCPRDASVRPHRRSAAAVESLLRAAGSRGDANATDRRP